MLSTLLGAKNSWVRPEPASLADWARLLLLSGLLSSLVFWSLLQPGFQFTGNDADLSFGWIFAFKFSRLWLAAGTEPWWNPFLNLGQSNLTGPANPLSLLNLLQKLFPSPEKGLDHSLFWLATVHSLTAVALFRTLGLSSLASLLSGLLLSCTGMTVAQLFAGHLGLYANLALLPLALLTLGYGLERSPIHCLFPAVLVLTAHFCTGDLQGAYLVCWLLLSFSLTRALLGSSRGLPLPTLVSNLPLQRRSSGLLAVLPWRLRWQETLSTSLKLALVFSLVSFLTAHIWLPPLIHQGQLLSSEVDPYAHSAPGLALLTLAIPHLFLGSGEQYSWVGWAHWEGQLGLGLTATVLALLGLLVGWRRDALLPMGPGLLSLLLGLGQATPVFSLYSRVDPIVGSLPVASRFFCLTQFFLILLFAMSFERLLSLGWEMSAAIQRLFLILSTILGVAWCFSYFLDGSFEGWLLFFEAARAGYHSPVSPLDYYVLSWTRFSAACLSFWALTYTLLRLRPNWRGLAIVSLLLLDVTRFARPYMNFRNSQDFELPPSVYEILEQRPIRGKVQNRLAPLALGNLALHQIQEWNPGSPLFQGEALHSAAVLNGALGLQQGTDHPGILSRFLGIEYFLQPSSVLKDPNLQQHYQGCLNIQVDNTDWSLLQDPESRPLLYLSRILEPASNPIRVARSLKANPEKLKSAVVYLDPEAHFHLMQEVEALSKASSAPASPFQEGAVVTQRLPNTLKIQCQLNAPAVLAINEAWEASWQARINGSPVRCVPAQLGLNRAVLVPAGRSEIEFRYQPQAVEIGRAVTTLSFKLALLVSILLAGVSGALLWFRKGTEK